MWQMVWSLCHASVCGRIFLSGAWREDFSSIEKKLLLPETMQAPVTEGEKAGVPRYELNGKASGEVDILTVRQCGKGRLF